MCWSGLAPPCSQLQMILKSYLDGEQWPWDMPASLHHTWLWKWSCKDAKSTLKESHNIHLALLNIRNTPPRGHSFSPAQRLMGRCTRSTLPAYRDLFKPEPPDPFIVYANVSHCKEACKTQYDKHMNTDLPPLPLGSHAYANPHPSKRGTPWIYGQIINNPSPCSYSLDTGNLVLCRICTQLRLAAPPQNNFQQPLAQAITQPSISGPPTISQDLNLQELDHPPAATFTQTERQPSQPPTTSQQQGTEAGATSPEATVPPSTTQQTTRSGRLCRKPKKIEDYNLY